MYKIIFRNTAFDITHNFTIDNEDWESVDMFHSFVEDTRIFETFRELAEEIADEAEINLKQSLRGDSWRISTDSIESDAWEEFVEEAMRTLEDNDVEQIEEQDDEEEL